MPVTIGGRGRRARSQGDPPSAAAEMLYDKLVNTIRSSIPDDVPFVEAKATAISLSENRQQVEIMRFQR